MNMQRIGYLLLAFLLNACSLAPLYRTPETAVPATFKENADWKIAEPKDGIPRGLWWEAFHDPELNRLEAQVSAANQDIKAALARLQQARATARVSRSDYFPTVTANASATKNRNSYNQPYFPATDSPYYHTDVLGADVSYELDVWGRVRNAVSSSESLAAASAADLAALDLSSHAELAKDYFQLHSYDDQQRLLEDSIKAYQQALELTQNLFDGGGASAADMALAKLQLQNAKTLATDTRLKRSQMEHAIAVLVGEPASTFSIKTVANFRATPPSVSAGLPSSLLERRPDIAGAERRVAAANAQIGVARAAFFPVFGLSGMAGYESTNTGNWISAPSLFWSMGPSAILTLFDGGRRDALTDQARAAYDEAATYYRQSVLVAYQEVEDNLSALRELELEDKSASAADEAAQDALIQANLRYQGGIASYLEVVYAQNAALQSRLSVTDIRARQTIATVLLVKTLGGDWQADAIRHD
jgi:NodT family efflux transporter outer membrane factor (OMF) lipoprotein